MAGYLALDGPELPVNIEDPIAKELVEDIVKARAFDVVRGVGEEEVLNIKGIGCGNSMGEVEETVDLESQ